MLCCWDWDGKAPGKCNLGKGEVGYLGYWGASEGSGGLFILGVANEEVGIEESDEFEFQSSKLGTDNPLLIWSIAK